MFTGPGCVLRAWKDIAVSFIISALSLYSSDSSPRLFCCTILHSTFTCFIELIQY